MLQDLLYALRLTRRAPGGAIVVLLTIAVGVGANAAIFSIIRAVLLAPLPFREPERLVELTERWPNRPGPRPISTLNYRDWANQSTVFQQMAAVSWGSVTVSDGSEPVYVDGSLVSPSYFELFGLHAAIGRTFAPDEDQPGRAHVVVVSHRLWASQFRSDPSVVGRSIRLDGVPYTVIGVMPARTSVRFVDAQLWRPLTYDWALSRGLHDLAWAAARLEPGVTLERARAEMDTIAAGLALAYPESNTHYGVRVERFPRPIGFDVATSLYLLFGAVGAVLLIGCVNLANLALARGAARSREVAIRTALGATRARLVCQFLTEHTVIALAGGCASLGVAHVLLRVAAVAIPTTGLRAAFPADTLIAMDGAVWLFALGLSVSSGVAFGLLPALGATRVPLTEVMKSGGPNVSAGRAQRRWRQLLIVGEVALAFMLATAAGLLTQSFFVLTSHVGAGYDSHNVLTVGLPIPPTRYESAAAINAYLDRIADRLHVLPEVRDVAFADARPTEGTPYGKLFEIEGQPSVPFGNRPVCGFKVVSPSYFRAVGLRLVRGRPLGERDRESAPLVVVINEMMARTYFSGVNPIGRRLLMRRAPVSGAPVDADLAWTVVGVAADEGVSPFDDRTTQAAVYVTREQHPRRNLDLVVRTTNDPRRAQESIRKAISEIDRDQAVVDFKTVKQLQRDDVAPDRLRSMLLTAFAGLAVVLAVLGLYGVIAHAVVQRTHEIGIRAALGASPVQVLRLVIGQAVGMIGLGIMSGLGMSLAAARLLRAFLFGVGPSDPATLLTVAAVLAGVAVLACYVPARRATRIDPLVALRSD